MTVAMALRALQATPVTVEGQRVAAVVWEDACTPGHCAGCTMRINGWPANACDTPLSPGATPVVLQPLPGFPVLVDLWVDRSGLARALGQAHAALPWEPGTVAGRMSQDTAVALQQDLRCTGCGACQTTCPSFHARSPYLGPAVMHALATWQRHPLAALATHGPLQAAVGEAGVAHCGNAHNCARACPVGVHVPSSTARLGGVASRNWLRVLLGQ